MTDLENRIYTITEEDIIRAGLFDLSRHRIACFLANTFRSWIRYEEHSWSLLDDQSKKWQKEEERTIISFFTLHMTSLIGHIATHLMLISFVSRPPDNGLLSGIRQLKHKIDQVDYMKSVVQLVPNLL